MKSRERMRALLLDATDAVTGGRMEDYGTPSENYQRIAGLWSRYLYPDKDSNFILFENGNRMDIGDVDTVIMMILAKIARLMESPDHYDTWKDIAGYAAVGYAVVMGDSDDKS